MPISGFPELLPGQRFVELAVLDRLRQTFELHGFAPLETPAVESLDQLLRKGEIEKEVYVLRRLHADDDSGDSGLGLHFDLTVPFARYFLEHAGHLECPFRRVQIQPAWRGERLFYTRRDPGAEHGVLCTRLGTAAGEGPEQVLVDPMAIDPSGLTTLDAWQPDKEGRLLAYQLSEGGDEESLLRVIDVTTGSLVDGPIDRCR